MCVVGFQQKTESRFPIPKLDIPVEKSWDNVRWFWVLEIYSRFIITPKNFKIVFLQKNVSIYDPKKYTEKITC